MATEIAEMSPTEARSFPHFSVHNAVAAQSACPEASCEAYLDIFTRRRWAAQGYEVRSGEDGTVVTTFIATPGSRGEAPADRRKRAILFCRHQVKARR